MAYFVIGDYRYDSDPIYTIPEGTVIVELEAPNDQLTYSDIPDNVIDPDTGNRYIPIRIDGLFEGCANLTTSPYIPDSVESMEETFKDCISLVQVNNLPSQLKNMDSTFYNCEKLRKIPKLPSTLTSMLYSFYNCYKLLGAFDMNTGVKEPIEIPATVTTISHVFYNCRFLTGDIYLKAGATTYSERMLQNAFSGTSAEINLHTYIPQAKSWLRDYSRWIFCNFTIYPIIINSKYLPEEKAIRVDMLLYETAHAGYITGMTPNGKLYDMNGNLIPWGTSFTEHVYCYAIFDINNPAPTSKLNIQVKNVAPTYDINNVGIPSTASLSQIKQEGKINPISPQIDVTNIRFNPKTMALNKYTVGDVIGITTTDMTKIQTRLRIDAPSDTEVKHFITHADNVKVSGGVSLQDWITEQYNNLT